MTCRARANSEVWQVCGASCRRASSVSCAGSSPCLPSCCFQAHLSVMHHQSIRSTLLPLPLPLPLPLLSHHLQPQYSTFLVHAKKRGGGRTGRANKASVTSTSCTEALNRRALGMTWAASPLAIIPLVSAPPAIIPLLLLLPPLAPSSGTTEASSGERKAAQHAPPPPPPPVTDAQVCTRGIM